MTYCFAKSLTNNGLAYCQFGTGQALVLIHGVGLCSESWFPMVDALKNEFRVTLVDLPGHGQSQPLAVAQNTASLSDYTKLIEQACRELQLQDFIVGGHSLGALIAIEMASNSENSIGGLLALNAIHQRSDSALAAVQQRALTLQDSQEIVGVEQTISRWFTDSPSPAMHDFAELCRRWLKANTIEAYAAAYHTFANTRGPEDQVLSRIDCPALFITGLYDLNSSASMSQALANRIPEAEYKIIADAAHMLPLTHANEVSAALSAWYSQWFDTQNRIASNSREMRL